MVALTPVGWLVEHELKDLFGDDLPWYWQIPGVLADMGTVMFVTDMISGHAVRGSVHEALLAMKCRGIMVQYGPYGALLFFTIAGTSAQIKSQTRQKSGVRGTGSFGIAPSMHLVAGRPWYSKA